MDMHSPVIDNQVIYAEHDVACAGCGNAKAILQMHLMVFMPCAQCRSEGLQLTYATNVITRWMQRIIAVDRH